MNLPKKEEAFTPNPSKAVSAARRVTDQDFAQEFPETHNLENNLTEYAQILRGKIQDCEKALQHVMDALEAIQKGKKPV